MPWHFGPSAVQLDAMVNHERSRRDIDVPAILSPRPAADSEALPTINGAAVPTDRAAFGKYFATYRG
jgi:hypothetical protein